MGVTGWVVIAVVVVGAVIALFGWDRYRGNRKSAERRRRPADERGFPRPDNGAADARLVQLEDRGARIPARLIGRINWRE